MREYELIYIIQDEASEEEKKKIQEKIKSLVEKNGKLTKEEIWGRKKLAYPIKGQDSGFYVVLNFQKNPQTLADLERNLALEEKVIRYLLVLPLPLPKPVLKEKKVLKKEKEKPQKLPRPSEIKKKEIKVEKVKEKKEVIKEEKKEAKRMVELEEKLKEILKE